MTYIIDILSGNRPCVQQKNNILNKDVIFVDTLPEVPKSAAAMADQQILETQVCTVYYLQFLGKLMLTGSFLSPSCVV